MDSALEKVTVETIRTLTRDSEVEEAWRVSASSDGRVFFRIECPHAVISRCIDSSTAVSGEPGSEIERALCQLRQKAQAEQFCRSQE